MSRYRITIRHAPGNRGDRKQYLDVDADSVEEAALLTLNEYDYEACPEDIEFLWEGEEPMDRQLRRMDAPMLPGMEKKECHRKRSKPVEKSIHGMTKTAYAPNV